MPYSKENTVLSLTLMAGDDELFFINNQCNLYEKNPTIKHKQLVINMAPNQREKSNGWFQTLFILRSAMQMTLKGLMRKNRGKMNNDESP